jgi:ATP-binding cassette subfamily C (CFTR/MRP) protein 1
VRLLRYVDHIVVLSDRGNISEQGTFAELSGAGHYVAVNVEDSLNEASVDTLSKDAIPTVEFLSNASAVEEDAPLDKARQIGDVNVYRYYFSFLSWKIGIMFLILQVCYAVLNTFPSKLMDCLQ